MRHDTKDINPASSSKEHRRKYHLLRGQQKRMQEAVLAGRRPSIGKLYPDTVRKVQISASALGLTFKAQSDITLSQFEFTTWEALYWWTFNKFPEENYEHFTLWEMAMKVRGTVRDFNNNSDWARTNIDKANQTLREYADIYGESKEEYDARVKKETELTPEQQAKYERDMEDIYGAGWRDIVGKE